MNSSEPTESEFRPFYENESEIEDIEEKFSLIPEKHADFVQRLIRTKYSNNKSSQYALHGAIRRLKILNRCIENTFSSIPIRLSRWPEDEEISDATINIQSFYLNLFGFLDNLAWILKYELQADLRDTEVGLEKNKDKLRKLFSDQLREYLNSIETWLDTLKKFRNPLAHKIPFYIPPAIVTEQKDKDTLNNFEIEKNKAFENRDFEKYDRLQKSQRRVGQFAPFIYIETTDYAGRLFFHPQLVSDFLILCEVGEKVLDEIDLVRAETPK